MTRMRSFRRLMCAASIRTGCRRPIIDECREDHAHRGSLARHAVDLRAGASCRWSMPYTDASPSPVPRSPLVVKNGSMQRRRVSSSMPMPLSATSICTASAAVSRTALGAQRQRAALRHGIDGVEHQVGQRVAQLHFVAHDIGQRRREILAQLDARCRAPAAGRASAAAVSSSTCSMARVNVSLVNARADLARPVELAHALDGAGHVFDGAPHRDQPAAAGLGDLRFLAAAAAPRTATPGEMALLMSCAMPLAISPSARRRSVCITVCWLCRRSS